jgi:thiol-disulfide isomerase/thioredoxin
MLKYTFFFLFLSYFLLSSCNDSRQANVRLSAGKWRAVISMQNQQMPFNFEVENRADSQIIYLVNGKEKLKLDEISYKNDSIRIAMPFYDCEIVGKTDGKKLEGTYIKRFPNKEYRLPVIADFGQTSRFETTAVKPTLNLADKWDVDFIEENGDTTKSVGIFAHQGTHLTGTFLTTTGDYRFLEGNFDGDKLNLSCFDGEHAFLFRAKMETDSTLMGTFWSGSAYTAKWVAHRNPNAALPNPDSLTFLKKGYERLNFSFPDLNGNDVSLADEKYKGKVVIVQMLGSWCPNCMDETIFLSKYYQTNKDKQIAIVGLAYERNPAFDEATKRLKKMKLRFGVEYDLLIAGTYNKAAAAATLPMLSHVLAFPTTIFIDKKGRVRKIHTGFNGPGTGIYYERFVEEFDIFIRKLLEEEAI